MESIEASVFHACTDALSEPLPVARFAQQSLHLSFAIMAVKKQFVEHWVTYLHINKKLVVLVCIPLHAFVALLELVIFSFKFLRWVNDLDLYIVLEYCIRKSLL